MNILHIDCSARPASHSRQLSAAIVSQLLRTAPDAIVTRRDIGREPVPHIGHDYATALGSRDALIAGQMNGALTLSEQLIKEVEAADVLVIGTPVNNFTVPSVLKAWIDYILRVGRTIGMGPTGEKVGLLHDKPVHIAIASGGFFTGEGARQPDFLTPYLASAFGCVGLRSLRFFPLQGTAFLDDGELAAQRDALLANVATTVEQT